MSRLAKIIPIRPEVMDPPTCFVCVHGYLGQNGVMCEITSSFVIDEKDAASCEAFQRGTTSA